MGERWYAWLMTQASRWHEPLVAERKRALMAGLRGDVLEIGTGAGGNLRYLHREVKWTGYEPNRILAARIASATVVARKFEVDGRLYDAVIATLVLCSVEDLDGTLRGIYESLRPGGRFVFVEHVGAGLGSDLRRAQQRWAGAWRRCAGGCHVCRDTEERIVAAGFVIESIERFELPMWLAGPHIAGVAVRLGGMAHQAEEQHRSD